MILTYKYRIKDRLARKRLRQHAVAVNQVWNYCVSYQRDIEGRYRAGAKPRKWPTHFDLTYLTAGTSKDLGLHANTIGEVCRFFVQNRKMARHAPRFRSSCGARRALGWIPFTRQGRQLGDAAVTYLGRTYRYWLGSRPLPETVRGGCFVEDARGRWFVCFDVEVEAADKRAAGQVGIDLGLKSLAVLSDGSTFAPRSAYRRFERALAAAQRAGNRSRVKAIHSKIKNARRDHLHKVTSEIVRNNSFIAVGDVSAKRLGRSRLAKSIYDAAWSTFRVMLEYKARRRRATFCIVNERSTSRACSICGVVPRSSPKGMGALGIRRWGCDECGGVHDRDVNAAINILNAALSVQRREDESRTAA